MDGIAGSSLRHLRVFEAVARVQCVRKAADAIHLTQPAVTQAIAKLEGQVQTVLFDRRSSGTYLTSAGGILASRVGGMFRQIEDALQAFGASTGQGRTLSSIAERITRPQIRTLTAMIEGGSFAGAIRCGMSQASLRRAARELDRNLGKSLFRKGVDGVVITPAGLEFARRLALAMRELESGVEEMRTASGKGEGEIRIGAMPLAGNFLLAPVLNEFTRSGSQARLFVRTGDGHELTKALRLGEVDFIVGSMHSQPDFEDIEQETLVPLSYVLVARQNHPITRKARVTRADLADYEWIAPSHGATRRAAFDRLVASMGKVPKVNIEASSLSTISLLLGGNDCLAMLARFEYEHENASGGLIALPVRGIGPGDPLGIMRRVNWSPTPLHLRFLDCIRSHAASLVQNDTRAGQAA